MTNTHSNIAVIGAGIMGLSVTERLCRTHSVTLFEPNPLPADNASWKAGGMLAPYSEIDHMNMDWVALGLEGITFWQDFATSHDIGFAQSGSLLIAHEQDRYIMERFAGYLPEEKRQYKTASAVESLLCNSFGAGLVLEEEAHLDPHKTMKTIVELIKERGVIIEERETTPEQIRNDYDLIIDCRGYNADDKDLRGVKGELALVRNTEFSLSRPVRMMHPRYPLYIVPRENNVFMIGATMIESGQSKVHVSVKSGLELLSALYSLHKSFGDAELLEIAAGIRPAYTDNLPRIKKKGNVVSCNGLFRHGFLFAPVMAETVEKLIANAPHQYMSLLSGESDEQDDENQDQRGRTNVRSAA
ncbi:MAG: FAD-dependent oxidoreductase [Pseudomonadota bacterium]